MVTIDEDSPDLLVVGGGAKMLIGNTVWQWFHGRLHWLAGMRVWSALGCRRPTTQTIATFSQGLAERNARTEQDFVRFGSTLRSLYANSTGLATLVRERAEALRSTLQESWVTGEHGSQNGLAAGMLRDLHMGLDEVSGLVCSLKETGCALGHLQTQVQNILRIGVYLNSSVIGFSIESARHPDCQQAFGAFVEELRTLATRVLELGAQITEDAKETQSFQTQRLDELSSEYERLRELVDDLESAACKTSAEARQLLENCFAALSEAEQCTSGIVRHADEAVFQLQTGDIIRQRTEHVIGAFDELTKAQPATGNPAAVAKVLEIQAHQLRAIAEESGAAQARLVGSFESIASETTRLVRALQTAQRASSGDSGSGTHVLAEFARDCQRMSNMLQQGWSLGDKARTIAEKAAVAASRLSRHFAQLTAINFEMHLQALNAIIKTAALGTRGATLEVLSSQVDRLFRDSTEQVGEILGTLERVKLGHSKATPKESDPGAEPSGHSQTRAMALRTGIEAVERAHRDFQHAAVEAERFLQDQESSIQQSRAELGFLSELSDALSSVIAEIEGLGRSLTPARTFGKRVGSTPEDSGGDRYTMQSERDIHDRVTRGITPVALVQPLGSALNGPQVSSQVTVASCRGPETFSPSNELIPEPSGAPACALMSADSGDHGLGDNVELF